MKLSLLLTFAANFDIYSYRDIFYCKNIDIDFFFYYVKDFSFSFDYSSASFVKASYYYKAVNFCNCYLI